MPINLNHQTPTEFAARFWQQVKEAKRKDNAEFHRLVWWLVKKISEGDISDNVARTTFNTSFGRSLTSSQWLTFKTSRMVPIHDRYVSMLNEGDL